MIRHINDSGVNKHHAALAVLGELEEDTELYSLIANGVDGYFIETMNIDDMFFYLANISKGIPYYSMRVLAPLIKRTITENALVRESSTSSLFDSLTPRERLILGKLCQGLTTQDICHELYLSQGTIKNHLRSIYHKLGVANKTQAVLVALGRGWNATKEERCSS